MPNRLHAATSPYLLQHADQPVDWWEWGPEAFDEARERDVPVLLSVGYSACHWCHVIAEESFADPATAAQLNEGFVAIKVDREERPDIDSIYLAATKAMTGSAGWPLTCVLTPAGEPFHCGTYYPATSGPGAPSFRQMLSAASTAWRGNGDLVRATAARIAGSLKAASTSTPSPQRLDAAVLDGALETLTATFDHANGGFGPAPKFPSPMAVEFLLRHHERTGSAEAFDMAHLTLEQMARGAIRDQLGGGFARYCVDAAWQVPHFEKMLSDNALLLRVYAHLSRLNSHALITRVAEETAQFLLSNMRTAEGGFVAALAANSGGVEGGAYIWDPAGLQAVLGDADAEWAASLLDITETGTFADTVSVPRLPTDPDDPSRWTRVRETLLSSRAQRPQPERDDKVITAWNGLAIAALAEAGAALGRPTWIAAAARTAAMLLDVHLVDGRLRRSSFAGVAGRAAGALEDYGCLADGLLALHQATGSVRWLEAARTVLDLALDRFGMTDEPGGYFDAADDVPGLLHRPRELTDGATPCGSSALTGALLTVSLLVARESAERYRRAADAALALAAARARSQPQFFGHWLSVAEADAAGPVQIAVAGTRDDPRFARLLQVARRASPGGSVVVHGPPDAPGIPLLASRPLVEDHPTAYVCHGTVCGPPVTTGSELESALRARRTSSVGEA